MKDNTACPDPGQPAPLQSCGHTAAPAGSLVSRYGAAALDEGYVAIPQVVLHYRRALGITAGEWDYLCEIFRYWRCAADPYPGIETLAAGLGCDPSTIRRHRLSLEAKGLLRVYRAGTHNCYNLTPLITAAVDLATRDQQEPPEPCKTAPAYRALLHAKEEGTQKNYDSDKTPTPRSDDLAEPALRASLSASPPPAPRATTPAVPSAVTDLDVLAATLAPISAEFGDDTPASSVTRARHLQAELGVSFDRFLAALDLAAERVRATAPTISILGATGTPQGIHYFFGVLKRELRGVTVRTRRPRSTRAEVARLWAEAPPPTPLAETHPVWRAVLEELRQILTPGNFEMWFAPTHALGQDGAVLRVAVPNSFAKDWLERKLGTRVAGVLRQVGYGEMRVEYVVEQAA